MIKDDDCVGAVWLASESGGIAGFEDAESSARVYWLSLLTFSMVKTFDSSSTSSGIDGGYVRKEVSTSSVSENSFGAYFFHLSFRPKTLV